ncbi:MAG: serine/threonine-protein kinase [Acidobacteria bacterium]|nr:serine/threonine-protein kinase [Acidobacteriota bacterium]
MSPQQLDRLRSILASSIQVPAESRPAYLASECGDDEGLRSELEALLSLHESADSFLSHSLPELLDIEDGKDTELLPGTVLKQRYRIERRIAQTSFATVYLASDELLGNMPVVVKRLDQLSDSSVLLDVFASELHALSSARHPNIVGISDVGTLSDGIPFLVLEFVPGSTLREVLRAGRVSLPRARSILRGVGRALIAAHKADVWHLDIKPENVIVFTTNSGEEGIKLIDFGVARLKSLHTPKPLLGGSPRYMAPEQDEDPSASCDIYALSLVAFEVFTGHLPYDNQGIRNQLPAALGPVAIDAIVKGLDLNPSNRPHDLSAFVEKLVVEPQRRASGTYAVLSAVAAIAAVGVFGYDRLARSPQRHQYSTPVSILVSPAIKRQPAFSPDGRQLYFAFGEVGRQDIYAQLSANGSPVPVVKSPADEGRPQISPDGKYLTFIRKSPRLEFIRRNLSNGEEVVLAGGRAIDTYSWGPDGNRIVFAELSNGLHSLQVLQVNTKAVTAVHPSGASDCELSHPSVSPDGEALAFTCRWAQGSDDLFVSKIGTDLIPIGPARRLSHRQDRIVNVQWAPDSKSVFYVAGPLGAGTIWRADLSTGGHPAQISIAGQSVESIAIPRHDWKLAFSQDLSQSSIWEFPLNGTASPRQVVTSSTGVEEGRLSPDGTMLLFTSGRSGDPQIWLASRDGSNQRQLSNFNAADDLTAIWSADSTQAIISVRSKELGQRIYSTPVHRPGSLTRVLDGGMACSVSRDGRWLYIVKPQGKKRSIWRTEYANAQTTELIAEGGVFGMESYDGKSFYYAKQAASEGIWRQPLPRGQAVRVVERLHRWNLFAVGKQGISYITPVSNADYPALFFKGFQQEAKLMLGFTHQVGWGLSLSSDGQTAVFTQVVPGDSGITLIDRFR